MSFQNPTEEEKSLLAGFNLNPVDTNTARKMVAEWEKSTKPVIEPTPEKNEPLAISSDTGKKMVNQAESNLAGFAQTLEAIKKQALDIQKQAGEIKPEKPTEPDLSKLDEEAGVTVGGSESKNAQGQTGSWITNPKGINEFVLTGQKPSWLTTEPAKTQAELDLEKTRTEIDDIKTKMAGLIIPDSEVANMISGITTKWDLRIKEAEQANKSRVAAIETSGYRTGGRYTGGIRGGITGSIISEEERQGMARIDELEAAKQSAILAAKQAQRENNNKVVVQQSDILEKRYSEQIKAVNDLKTAQATSEQQIIENRKLNAEYDKIIADTAQKKAEGFAPFLADYLTGNIDEDTKFLSDIQKAHPEIDITTLLSAAMKYRTERYEETLTEETKNLNAYNQEREASGLKPATREEYLNLKVKDLAGNTITVKDVLGAQMSLRKEMNQLPIIKDFNQIKSAFATIQSAYREAISAKDKKSKAPADQILVVSFNKMIDPGSVVREGEFARSTQGQSLLARFQGKMEGWISGGVGLTNEDRKSIVDATERLYNDYLSLYNDKIEEYRGYAKEYGANPDSIGKSNISESDSAAQYDE